MVRVRRICCVCGAPINWRRRWANHPQRLEYCSERCRQQGVTEHEKRLETAILDLLAQRPVGASICPSEVARALCPDPNCRAEMDSVRAAARRLQRAGQIEVTQRSHPVDLRSARGPVRLRLKPQGAIQA